MKDPKIIGALAVGSRHPLPDKTGDQTVEALGVEALRVMKGLYGQPDLGF